jgi:HK97 family phage major capsid protein
MLLNPRPIVKRDRAADAKAVKFWQRVWAGQRAQGESPMNTAGGFLVPSEVAAEIVSLRDAYGAFRQTAQVFNMGSDVANVPKRSGGITASWTAENANIDDQDVSFDGVGLTARKLTALVKVSNDLIEDSAPDLAAWLADEAAFAFAVAEDQAGFIGDGTSTYAGCTGVLNRLQSPGIYTATGHATTITVTTDDLAGLMALLPSYGWPRAAWICHQKVAAQVFYRLAGVYMSGGVPSYAGLPIIVTTAMPSAPSSSQLAIVLGDMSLCAMLGDRRKIRVRRLVQRYGDTDQTGFLMTERVCPIVWGLSDTASPGAAVALKLG